ncbi:glycosyltransferase family 2 protein [Secundilactobacillus folii]|uniref:Glycosyltransferase n=1 Tax=Secundilactobacillus folii TaxID=2678357 RepID=A0A7X2XUR5_9LACO|nr:glycosyltransferase family 2 protein [Secundilactobacillus folii]MTV81875.1 glycosyltransferase [Secundilactobacillus folii]
MKTISIVVPCYNEEAAIPIFYRTIESILLTFCEKETEMYRWEYWFVNDGSTDKSLDQMKIINASAPHQVHFVDFSRNFGKEAALKAGLEQAKGDYVAVMDVDLQDPPELLPQMIRILNTTDNDVVATKRGDRKGEPKVRSWLSNLFYKLINHISQVKMQPGVRDYRLMRRAVVKAVLALPESNRFSKGIFSWVGFKTETITFKNRPRVAGETHWSMRQLLDYSLGGILDYSELPLTLASWGGISAFVLAIIGMVTVVVRKMMFGDPTMGWASLVSIILFVGGIQLFSLGIIGKYISKIYLETKHRPAFLIREKR